MGIRGAKRGAQYNDLKIMFHSGSKFHQYLRRKIATF
jgi:hypothetical protein